MGSSSSFEYRIYPKMLTILFMGAFGYVSQAASKIEASWSFCTGSDAEACPYGKYANITGEVFVPNPPPIGQNFSIMGSGYSFQAIQDPSYTMHIQEGAFVNAKIN